MNTEILSALRKQLEAHREKSGLSHYAISKVINGANAQSGAHRIMLNMTGRENMTWQRAVKIAAAMGLEIGAYFTLKPKEL